MLCVGCLRHVVPRTSPEGKCGNCFCLFHCRTAKSIPSSARRAVLPAFWHSGDAWWLNEWRLRWQWCDNDRSAPGIGQVNPDGDEETRSAQTGPCGGARHRSRVAARRPSGHRRGRAPFLGLRARRNVGRALRCVAVPVGAGALQSALECGHAACDQGIACLVPPRPKPHQASCFAVLLRVSCCASC